MLQYRGLDAGGFLSDSIAIETHGLEKTYAGGVKALQGVDLEVPTGCCFGLLGPNGAGKSTLVKCLLSIVHPTAGSGKLRGKDIRHANSREGVGYLPEGHRFPRYLTARGLCEFYGRLGGLSGPELKKQADEKLNLVGLGDWVDTKVNKFSKGMSQRVGVAQALMGNPTLIFLDEPTDGVDPVAREGLRTVIKQATASGATVFINSHLLSEIEVLCDHVAILDRGTILEQGSVSQITAAVAGEKLRVRMRTDPLPDALWQKLTETLGAQQEPDGYFVVELDDESEIPPIIDQLRAEGLGVFAIEPRRLRLEEAFIELIQASSGKKGLEGLRVEKRS